MLELQQSLLELQDQCLQMEVAMILALLLWAIILPFVLAKLALDKAAQLSILGFQRYALPPLRSLYARYWG